MLKVKEWLEQKKFQNSAQYRIQYDPSDFMPCAARFKDNKMFKWFSKFVTENGTGEIYEFDLDRIHIHIDFLFNDNSSRLYKIPINLIEQTKFEPY